MTEDEKKRFRKMKEDAVSRLHSLDLGDYGYALGGTDARLLKYAEDVISSPSRHNLYELLALLSFFAKLDKYRWRADRVKSYFKFYEILRFNGAYKRCRYKLTPIQCFQFANIFGFVDDNGNRLCHAAYIFVPRKFSKTTSAASLAVYDMMFGDYNAQAYIGANSYQQAKICFDEIRAIMRDVSPDGRNIRINREKIMWNNGQRDSFIQCLSSNAKTLDGLNASLVIMDEYAQARNTANKSGADLKNVLTSSMGARVNPLTVVITTASDVVDGAFAHELEGVKAILRGEVENDRVFASIFMPDVDDEESDPNTWAKVQPHLGVTVRPDFYANEYANAQMSAENMLTFRTKLLNIFTINEAKTWFSYEKAKELVGDFDIDKVQGHPACAVAFDLSVHDDFSAVSYTLYDASSKRFYSHTDYYFPEGALNGHPNGELYKQWNADGYLKLCNGDKIDVNMIAADILKRSKVTNIVRIGYDSYKSQELVSILSTVGARNVILPFPQTYGSFNLPVESFEMLAYDSPPRITINNNPINIFCLTNCILDEDRLENKKPIKASQYRKIDGVITMLMTIGQLSRYER